MYKKHPYHLPDEVYHLVDDSNEEGQTANGLPLFGI